MTKKMKKILYEKIIYIVRTDYWVFKFQILNNEITLDDKWWRILEKDYTCAWIIQQNRS